jgi:hypothetical protein
MVFYWSRGLTYSALQNEVSMKWETIIPLLLTTSFGVVGWWVGHRLSGNRDRENKKRDKRVSYLIDAYRRLERASNPSDPSSHSIDLETAIADIQLFGSAKQVALAESFAKEFASRRSASLDSLLAELRDDLRKELNLEPIGHSIVFLRIINNEPKRSEPEASQGGSRGSNSL